MASLMWYSLVSLSLLATALCQDTCGGSSSRMKDSVDLVEDSFGFMRDNATQRSELVRRFTMTNKNGMSVQIITYGAIVTSLKVPDSKGNIEDVVLGFDDMSGYLREDNPYFGAVVGRVANRIRNGQFTLGDTPYQVSQNRAPFHLHGGFKGFDKAVWTSHVERTRLTLSHLSPDGDEGYPGQVLAQATYTLTADNTLLLEMTASATKPTPVNLASHSYFNLAGHKSGADGVKASKLSVNADLFTATDDTNIPTGELRGVGGTALDLRIPRTLGEALLAPELAPTKGFDHNLCVNRGDSEGMRFVARAVHESSGRVMEVHSDQPGVQVYTGNFMPDVGEQPLPGKDGARYTRHSGFCLETQNYPDAVNHKNFPDSVLLPGSTYTHRVSYRFGVL